MSSHSKFKWVSSAATHVGHVRQVNEDAYLDRGDIGLWAVADGMGGHHAGDVASSKIVELLNDIELDTNSAPLSALVDSIEDKIIAANNELVTLARSHNDNRTIGSTVVTLATINSHCALLWAGDSRAYRYRNNETLQLTRDHSQVEEMVQQGLLQREEAESHPASNVITRAVGASDKIFIDIEIVDTQVGDTYLLCSDGLNKHLSDSEINELLKLPDVNDISEQLVATTLARGAIDNVTVVVARALANNS